MTRSVDELLAGVLRDDSRAQASSGQQSPDELDVAEFAESLGKTAEDLEKAAESLPSQPQIVAEQLRSLGNPLAYTRRDSNEQAKKQLKAVLPAASQALSIPTGLDQISNLGKSASEGEGTIISRLLARGS